MTVIAYDGRYVAADKQSTMYGNAQTVTKLKVHGTKVYVFCGGAGHGLMMVAWHIAGAVPNMMPKETDEKQRSDLYVFERGKHVLLYQSTPLPEVVEDVPYAGGCARDGAMAAMRCGKTVREAIEIASIDDIYCGRGVDVIDLWELSNELGGQSATTATGGGAPRDRELPRSLLETDGIHPAGDGAGSDLRLRLRTDASATCAVPDER